MLTGYIPVFSITDSLIKGLVCCFHKRLDLTLSMMCMDIIDMLNVRSSFLPSTPSTWWGWFFYFEQCDWRQCSSLVDHWASNRKVAKPCFNSRCSSMSRWPWELTLNAVFHLTKQSTHCGGPAWRKTCKQNSFCVGVVCQTQSIV